MKSSLMEELSGKWKMEILNPLKMLRFGQQRPNMASLLLMPT